jgi:hypothetical protein
MSTTNFSLEPIRTKENLTCGIVNVPLTYPSRIFFVHNIEDKDIIEQTYAMLEYYNIAFERSDIIMTNKCHIKSIGQVDPKILKTIWRNFKLLRPKFDSDHRYPFWEIDTKDFEVVEQVLSHYQFLRLPVYVHESMMGYHFVCIKPILKEKYSWFIRQVRHTNLKYPPITLRIKPNKYVMEENTFFKGNIIYDTNHSDTERLKHWIETQNFIKIGENYMLVWYQFDKKQEVIVQ